VGPSRSQFNLGAARQVRAALSSCADDKDGERMAETPERADDSRLGNSLLLGNDSSDSNYVIRIRGMTHSEKKT
jgi:hypothetical protein